VSTHLEMVGAAVRFGATDALAGVDLEAAPGEILVILGPSGSGKSTLLRGIAGLQHLDAGRVILDGDDVTDLAPHRRDVGLMFQDHALFPHLDVRANVAFGLRMHRWKRDAAYRRVSELLELVGLPSVGHRRIQTLSGGEQQRVALARALAPQPRLLLLDEPLGALDRPLRERLVLELRQLFAQLGVTVIAVTHDQAEAFALADRLVVMDGGRVLQTGAPSELWSRPATARVASLLGFTNVAAASSRNGRLITPWGDLGAADSSVGAVLVRPDGIRIDPAGAMEATVLATRFAGASTLLRVDVSDAPDLDLQVGAGDVPCVGASVRLSIDPSAVVALSS
jgi:thiamine transport system ATP-binding protein